jgi:O-acetyl-ADP-ribose deacetylase (regulator of RNase III)
MSFKTVHGNLWDELQTGDCDVLVHGANCMHQTGAGFAKQVKKLYPGAYQVDVEKTRRGDRGKLGTITVYLTQKADGRSLFIVNAYTQYDYRGPFNREENYQAIRSCMRKVSKMFPGRKVIMPRIGTGLAAGDWERIEGIVQAELENVTVCVL